FHCLPHQTVYVTRVDPNMPLFLSWAELLSWVRVSSTNAHSLIRKISVQASIYHLWKQRNNFVHNQVSLPPSTIFNLIYREVRNIITARR
ncbi:unnamed protein product, partial [Arabidopsis halleri]